jgi:predicted alpha/beta hydrolase
MDAARSIGHSGKLVAMPIRDFQLKASDGYALQATVFLPPMGKPSAGVILNSATGVHRRFYARFATYLAEHWGYAVLTYDYRGIGDSRPSTFRGFTARLRDWPQLDTPAAIEWLHQEIRPSRLFLVGHSAGGNLIGLIPNLSLIDAVVLVGAQLGYWRLWPKKLRYAMAATWYFAVPVLSRLFGYVPGWLGAGQHWPHGIANELARWCRHPDYLFGDPSLDKTRFAEFDAPILAMTFADDPHATRVASERLLARFPRALITRRHFDPHEIGVRRIGHFGFFRPFSESLWQECATWLSQVPVRNDSRSGRGPARQSILEHGANEDNIGDPSTDSTLARRFHR